MPVESSPASISSSASWSIACGSLASSITFESSCDDDGDNHDPSSAVDSSPNLPLILYPPSSDPSPCEITLTFPRKHEVQQIYVRSTARVYEIYCAAQLGNSSEYLCTVRCCVAARGEHVLRCADVEEAVLKHLKGLDKELDEGKGSSNGSDLTSNEDDWVEVKAHDTTTVVGIKNFLSSNLDANPGRSLQDLYEATAEISDANPCMSITLKLLSLQDKSCVHVDEIYVFADPVDTSDLDNQLGSVENPAGSSLMTLLMPAFFQLSKTKDVGRTQDTYTINTKETQKLEGVGSRATDIADNTHEIQQVVMQEGVQPTIKPLQEGVSPAVKPLQVENPQVSDAKGTPSMCHTHTEGVLDQLVSRISRIEHLFLRFEENMLKPISSIDERLQRVEQQLELLTKKTENCGLFSGTQISAPEFSYGESESNSFNSGSRHLTDVPCEANKKNSHSPVLSISQADIPASVDATSLHPGSVIASPKFSNCDSTPVSMNSTMIKSGLVMPHPGLVISAPEFSCSDANSASMNSTILHPGLIIAAPEFSNCDDEEEDLAGEPGKEMSKDEPKHEFSSYNSSAYTQCLPLLEQRRQEYTSTYAVKALEFPNEENSHEKVCSPRSCFTELNATEKHALESVNESPKQKLKHALSIDDALASTLAGFIASVKCQKYTEFHETSESLNKGHSEADHSSGVNEADGMEHIRGSFSSLSNTSADSSENGSNVVQTDEVHDELLAYGDWVKNVAQGTCIDRVTAPVLHDVALTSSHHIAYEIGGGEEVMSNSSDLEHTDNLEKCSGYQIDDGSNDVQEGADLSVLVTSQQVMEEQSNHDILKEIVGFSCATSLVDFETPILHVEFSSQEGLKTESSLEALLSGTQDVNFEAPLKESWNHGHRMGNQCDLVSVEDWGAFTSVSDGLIPVDMDYYNLREQQWGVEADKLQDYNTFSRSHELQEPSLI